MSAHSPGTPDVAKVLAPGGVLRAAISIANPVLVQTDPLTGETAGIAVDLAQELAHRLGVPLQKVPIDSPAKCFEAIQQATCGIGFLAIDSERAKTIDYTAAYVVIEGSYAVRADSPIKVNADVDRAGVRVAVKAGTAYEAFLTRALRTATLIRADDPFDLFLHDRLDAVAGVRQAAARFAGNNLGVRMLDGRFMAIEHAMCLPKGRDAGAHYLRAFVEEMKSSGFVSAAIQRAGQDVVVAGAQS